MVILEQNRRNWRLSPLYPYLFIHRTEETAGSNPSRSTELCQGMGDFVLRWPRSAAFPRWLSYCHLYPTPVILGRKTGLPPHPEQLSAPLLKTKLSVQQFDARLVTWPSLITSLTECINHLLTFIRTLAGHGKKTLLCECPGGRSAFRGVQGHLWDIIFITCTNDDLGLRFC